MIKSLDHTVFTVKDIFKTINFYKEILGFEIEIFSPKIDPNSKRYAMKYGSQKINLHQFGQEFSPKAQNQTIGSQDVCFLLNDDISLEEAMNKMKQFKIPIIGPINTIGAMGPFNSFYIRDPDGNLIELAKY